MDKKIITKSGKETKKMGEDLARWICSGQVKENRKSAVVIGLSGNLGGGKTTFLQGFAKGLGIKEKILSPTFVILKHFKITNQKFTDFYHIDCYRLKTHEDILELNFENIILNPKNIVAIEWPEKIKKVLPKNLMEISFKFVDENKREISFEV